MLNNYQDSCDFIAATANNNFQVAAFGFAAAIGVKAALANAPVGCILGLSFGYALLTEGGPAFAVGAAIGALSMVTPLTTTVMAAGASALVFASQNLGPLTNCAVNLLADTLCKNVPLADFFTNGQCQQYQR